MFCLILFLFFSSLFSTSPVSVPLIFSYFSHILWSAYLCMSSSLLSYIFNLFFIYSCFSYFCIHSFLKLFALFWYSGICFLHLSFISSLLQRFSTFSDVLNSTKCVKLESRFFVCNFSFLLPQFCRFNLFHFLSGNFILVKHSRTCSSKLNLSCLSFSFSSFQFQVFILNFILVKLHAIALLNSTCPASLFTFSLALLFFFLFSSFYIFSCSSKLNLSYFCFPFSHLLCTPSLLFYANTPPAPPRLGASLSLPSVLSYTLGGGENAKWKCSTVKISKLK